MYKPEGSRTLAEVTEQQIRLCIQGYPKTGKTWAALTFPNPVVLNLDRGLGAHIGKENILEVPLWDSEYAKKFNPNDPTNLKDIILIWLNKEGRKLESDQTLIIDGSTGIQNAYHAYMTKNPPVTKQGKIDDRAEWALKIPYFSDIFEMLKTFKCHVIYICHETPERDKAGELNGKVRPLLSGQAGDQLASHFSDLFRQHTFAKPTDFTKVKPDQFGMTLDEFKQMCNEFTTNTIYVWQTQSDDISTCGSSSLVGQPRYIKSDYETFCKYKKSSFAIPPISTK